MSRNGSLLPIPAGELWRGAINERKQRARRAKAESDVVYLVVSRKTGVPLACFANLEDAEKDSSVTISGGIIEGWVCRGLDKR